LSKGGPSGLPTSSNADRTESETENYSPKFLFAILGQLSCFLVVIPAPLLTGGFIYNVFTSYWLASVVFKWGAGWFWESWLAPEIRRYTERQLVVLALLSLVGLYAGYDIIELLLAGLFSRFVIPVDRGE